MGTKYCCKVCCLAVVFLCVLAVAGRAGCSTDIELQLLTQTSARSQDFHLVRSFRGIGPARVRHRAVPLRRLLIIISAATAAAAVTFVVLGCFRIGRTGHRYEGVQRSLADAGNKDVLGACGGAPDDQRPDAPATSSKEGSGGNLKQRLRRALRNVEELSRACKKAALRMPTEKRLTALSRLVLFATLELGALAVLLEGPLEDERKAAVQVVLDAVSKVVSTKPGGPKFAKQRNRLHQAVRQLEEVKENKTEGAPLAPEKRQQMLLDLVFVQEESMELTAMLTKKLASLPKKHFLPFSSEAKVLEKKLQLLCHRRKMQILPERELCARLQQFARLAHCDILGIDFWLASSEALSPPLSGPEQIQQLHAALREAEETVAQELAGPSSSLEPPQGEDGSMPLQQAEGISFYQPAPAPFAPQIQPAHHPPLRPDAAERPLPLPQHQEGLMVLSQPLRGSRQAQPVSSFESSLQTLAPSASPEQPHDPRRIHPQEGTDHRYPPADGIPSGHSQAASLTTPSSQPLHVGAPEFFPATQSRAPGAHVQNVPFYGFPRGEPAPPGHLEDPNLDGNEFNLDEFVRATLASLNAFYESP